MHTNTILCGPIPRWEAGWIQVGLVHSPCHPPSFLVDREPELPGSPTPSSCLSGRGMRNTRMLSGATWVEKRLQHTGLGHGLAGCTLRSGPMLGLPVGRFSFQDKNGQGDWRGRQALSWVSCALFHQVPVTVRAGG